MEFDPQVQNRWLISLVCGVLFVGSALLARRTAGSLPTLLDYAPLAFCAVGLFCGALSLLAKEKNRKLAYIGVGVNVVPWLYFILTSG
jgi:hypothetical protein